MIKDPRTIRALSSWRARAVVQAEMEFIAARVQVRSLQEKALLSGGYDPEDYDTAILTYREARAWVTVVREAWRCWQAQYDQADGVALR